MSETTFQKNVLALCDQALALPPEQRGAFLLRECADNKQLHNAVAELLHSIDAAQSFLDVDNTETAITLGTQVGEYRIVRELGIGGMGCVFLAERTTENYTQRVALKILRAHLQNTDMISRFNEERRILARLNHPYIAGLVDGGMTEQGLPYLVMEFIEGIPIDQYCDQHQLTIRDRLQLIRQAALAIQSAHQNLVVHSDLKPNNILITEDGIPKLLDFGIAKLVRADNAEPISCQPYEPLALTPDYASPEQIAGHSVTTLSDVYSLGVLTYKLLVGSTPYQLKGANRSEMSDTLDSTTSVAPSKFIHSLDQKSMQALAASRNISTIKLSRELSKDIDAILAKALEKDPPLRYASAFAFANDLNSFCLNLPVTVAGNSTLYRLRKFIGRNRFSVAAGVAGILALIGGSALSLWQAQIAEQRFKDLHGFAEKVIFDLQDEIENLPGSTGARQLMLKESLHYLDRLAQDAGDDRPLQLDLSKAYKRLGDVLGNPNTANLGDAQSALSSYEKALTIAEHLSNSLPDDTESQRHKGVVLEKIADVLAWQDKMDEALEYSENSLRVFQGLLDSYPDRIKAIKTVAISHVKRGDLLGHPHMPNAGMADQALEEYRRALSIITPLAHKPTADGHTQRYYALIYERVGTMLSTKKQFDEAIAAYKTSRDIRMALAASDPSNGDYGRDAGVAQEKIGDLHLARGNAEAAIPLYEKAIKMYRVLADTDPDNAHAIRTLAIGLENLCDALEAASRTAATEPHFAEILTLRRSLVQSNPNDERFAHELEQIIQRARSLGFQ